jgi:hypothetical protein
MQFLRRIYDYFTRFDTLSSLGGWLLWPLGTTWAAIMATAFAYTGWFWDAYGWAGVASIGFGSWLLFAVALPLIGLGARLLRPSPPIPTPLLGATPVSAPGAPLEEIDGLRTEVQQVSQGIGNLGRLVVADAKARDQRFDQLSQGLSSLTGRVAVLEANLKPKPEGLLGSGHQFESRLDAIEAKIDDVRKVRGVSTELIKQRLDGLNEYQSSFAARTMAIFRAKQVEERLELLLPRMDELAKRLNAPTERPNEPIDWATWTADFKQWETMLHEVLTLAKPYADQEGILSIDPDTYKSRHWTFDEKLFPNSDAVLDYRKFRTLLMRFDHNAAPIIKRAVGVAAWVNQSEYP